jgi:hypothetical protein
VNVNQLKARAAEIKEEVKKATKAVDSGRLEAKRYEGIVNKAYDEYQNIENMLENLQKGMQFMGAWEALHGGNVETKAFAVGPQPHDPRTGPRRMVSPLDLTQGQLKSMADAMTHRTPFALEVKAGGAFMSGAVTKSPVLESGIGGSFSGQLPPVQTRYAVGLGLEPVRTAAWLAGAVMSGPSATWRGRTRRRTVKPPWRHGFRLNFIARWLTKRARM